MDISPFQVMIGIAMLAAAVALVFAYRGEMCPDPADSIIQFRNDVFFPVELYKGNSKDAKMAQVAAKVEGLCYQPVPGSDVINARWTRVEGEEVAVGSALEPMDSDRAILLSINEA